MIARRQSSLRLVPTGNMTGLLFILAAMWYAGASQGNGAAYCLFFLLFSVLLVSVPKTLLNLASLKITTESIKPGFAGQEVSMPLEIANLSKRPRNTISTMLPRGESEADVVDEIAPGLAARTVLRFPAAKRGEHEITGLLLTSAYPLGFFRARHIMPVSQRYIVYPRPAGDPDLPPPAASAKGRAEVRQTGGDDFSGMRAYVPGESQRHIDWKAVARGQPMMTKQFAAETDGMLHFDFMAMPQKGVEVRLSQLALWVIEAERARRPYSLRLPSRKIPASLGEAHYHKCLRALALHR